MWRDPDAAQRMSSADGGNAGNEVGSIQPDAVGAHPHELMGAGDAIVSGRGAEWVRFHGTKVPDDTAPVLTNSAAVLPAAGLGTETRPVNVYVNWIIRVR